MYPSKLPLGSSSNTRLRKLKSSAKSKGIKIVHDHESTPCGNICCYADDSTFSYSSSGIQEISDQISENYTGIAQFMSNNKLKLNGDKTHLNLRNCFVG
jgi:hypothetical protein